MTSNKHFIYSLFLALICTVAFSATAKNLNNRQIGITPRQAMSHMAKKSSVFSSDRAKLIEKNNANLFADELTSLSRTENSIVPSTTIGPNHIFYDIDGPDGRMWYCTANLISKSIEHQYYTEYILNEYSYTIYDADFNLVGTIHDKMRYQADEVRVPGPEAGIGILPVITRNFFNSDDNYEVVISIAVNTTTPGYNHYRSVVYSINGEKETVKIDRNGTEVDVEVDKPVSQFTSFVSDVLNASTDTEERIYMTFMGEYGIYPDIDFDKLMDGDEAEGKKYWNSVANNGYKFTLYGKAGDDGKLVKVFEDKVTYQTLQGDQESTPVMITFTHDNEPYILLPKYKETFFNPYYSPFEDMTMRENNALVVNLYKISGTTTSLVSTTNIPVEKVVGNSVLATYFSVGDLRYADDIEFDANGKPVYTVTRCNYTTVSDETSGFCYYKYDSEGNKILTIFENAESKLLLTDVPGKDSQAMFVIYDYDEGYLYNFVDLSTGYNDKTVKISYLLDTGFDDYEVLSFNADRVPIGNSYKYAFEMRAPLVDEEDNNFIRIAWFNADGSFDRIDHVNMGKSVNYATVYIDGKALQPTFISNDPEHEYMVLIKRSLSEGTSTAREELMIAQPAAEDLTGGNTLLHLIPCEKGDLNSISINPGASDDTNRLFIGYWGNHGYTADFYDLPFASSFVDHITIDKGNTEIAFDGATLRANKLAIKVYNTYGALVAEGIEALDITNLAAGIYIAHAGSSSVKFIVK